jgi:hypothetical protein
MRIPKGRRAWFRSEALRRVLLECRENDYRRYLLAECIEAYLALDEPEQQEFALLLLTEPYKEIGPMMLTTYEKGGIETARRILLCLGRKRFGDPEATALASLQAITDLERLEQLSERLLEVTSWQELLQS